jgi:hypothetical protein
MAFRNYRSSEYFSGSPVGENAAGYASKAAEAVNAPVDERGRQTDLDIADIQAETLRVRAETTKDTLDARADAAEKVNKRNIQGNQQKGLFSLGGSILTAGLSLFSDRRIKNTIAELDNAVSLLKELRPVSFYYNKGYGSDSDRLHYGFIAQEYAEHMPDATYTDDDTGMLCINTMELISILVKANQELEERIARLEVKDKLAGAVR